MKLNLYFDFPDILLVLIKNQLIEILKTLNWLELVNIHKNTLQFEYENNVILIDVAQQGIEEKILNLNELYASKSLFFFGIFFDPSLEELALNLFKQNHLQALAFFPFNVLQVGLSFKILFEKTKMSDISEKLSLLIKKSETTLSQLSFVQKIFEPSVIYRDDHIQILYKHFLGIDFSTDYFKIHETKNGGLCVLFFRPKKHGYFNTVDAVAKSLCAQEFSKDITVKILREKMRTDDFYLHCSFFILFLDKKNLQSFYLSFGEPYVYLYQTQFTALKSVELKENNILPSLECIPLNLEHASLYFCSSALSNVFENSKNFWSSLTPESMQDHELIARRILFLTGGFSLGTNFLPLDTTLLFIKTAA